MRESCIIYRSFYEALAELPDDQRLRLYDAIMRYSLDGIDPALTGVDAAVFKLIKPQIDANAKRYENGKKGAEHGSKGGRPKTETPPKPQNNPTKTPNVNVNVNVNENDNAVAIATDARARPRPRYTHEFLIWYERYPHRVGKADAAKAFEKAWKKADLQTLIDGVERYISTKPPDRNWCNPATWLNQERWNDEPMEVKTDGRRTQPTQAERADAAAAEALRRLGCPDDENPYAAGQAELRRVPSLRQIPGEHHKRSHGVLGSPASIPGKQDNLCLQNLDE